MTFSIIGSGNVGAALARQFARNNDSCWHSQHTWSGLYCETRL